MSRWNDLRKVMLVGSGYRINQIVSAKHCTNYLQ
jgi:hypothetical protein